MAKTNANAVKMKVIDLSHDVLRLFVKGCEHKIKKEEKEGTFIEGHKRGVEDGLQLVSEYGNLPFVMQMAILGLQHRYDGEQLDPFYKQTDTFIYKSGYRTGLDDVVRILTGE